MKQQLKSLRFRMLLPVVSMTLFVVILLTVLFSRAYTNMILQQEQEVNAVGFESVSHSVTPLIDTSISAVRSILTDARVTAYARHEYSSGTDMIHARIKCRDYLRSEMTRHDGIFGLLFMRKDGSMFGTLPEANLFMDEPQENPLPKNMKTQILNAPRGQIVWVGPLSGNSIYGFENEGTPQHIMIAAWKTVDVSYGELYAMMLMDESIFAKLFDALQDGKSNWYLFTADQAEIYSTGTDAQTDPSG